MFKAIAFLNYYDSLVVENDDLRLCDASRRIDETNRLVIVVDNNYLTIISCRYHYEKWIEIASHSLKIGYDFRTATD